MPGLRHPLDEGLALVPDLDPAGKVVAIGGELPILRRRSIVFVGGVVGGTKLMRAQVHGLSHEEAATSFRGVAPVAGSASQGCMASGRRLDGSGPGLRKSMSAWRP
ncbi:MAG: hypothetical protein ACOY9C_04845 [Pseudomonadota bacterium]